MTRFPDAKEHAYERIPFEIKQHLGILSKNPRTGWTKELNMVSWNGEPEKLDIRSWDPEHNKMSKGLTLDTEEGKALKELLNKRIEL